MTSTSMLMKDWILPTISHHAASQHVLLLLFALLHPATPLHLPTLLTVLLHLLTLLTVLLHLLTVLPSVVFSRLIVPVYRLRKH